MPVPFDDKSPFVTSGIRVGVPAITTRGMRRSHANSGLILLTKCYEYQSEDVIASVKKDVQGLMKDFPLYPEIDITFQE